MLRSQIQKLTRKLERAHARTQAWQRAATKSRLKVRELEKRREKKASRAGPRRPVSSAWELQRRVNRLEAELRDQKARRRRLRIERDEALKRVTPREPAQPASWLWWLLLVVVCAFALCFFGAW